MSRLVDVKREQMIDGMGAIIRRLCRLGPRGDLILMHDEYSERELAIKLLCFVEGLDPDLIDWDAPAQSTDGRRKA
jgi:hypothetical protein